MESLQSQPLQPLINLISTACNRQVHGITWYHSYIHNANTKQKQFVAYGAGKLIAIYDIIERYIVVTLKGHNDYVSAVACFQPLRDHTLGTENQGILLVSGSVDGQLIVWSYNPINHHTYHIIQTIIPPPSSSSSPTNSIVTIDTTTIVLHRNHAQTPSYLQVILYATSDGSIHIMTRNVKHLDDDTTEFQYHQSIPPVSNRSVLSVAIQCVTLGNNDTPLALLTAGGASNHIYLYAAPIIGHTNELLEFASIIQLEGHNDWIRCISWCTLDNNNTHDITLLLASASQDKTIRLWRFTHTLISSSSSSSSTANNESLDNSGSNDIDMSLTSIGSRTHRLRYSTGIYGGELSIVLESVLHGHENWVMSCRWATPVYSSEDRRYHQPLVLLSASTDKTLLLWKPHSHSATIQAPYNYTHTQHSIWVIDTRVGEQGGHTLGFYGAHLGNTDDGDDNNMIMLANGYSGSLHVWGYNKESDTWLPSISVCGHSNAVCDIQWDKHQQYLMSVSSDQTTRIFCEYSVNHHYYEIARPQIHGYDLNCITPIYHTKYKHLFVSGADEKVIRIFYAPQPFIYTLANITGNQDIIDEDEIMHSGSDADGDSGAMHLQRARHAHIPELGLSNKAHLQYDKQSKHDVNDNMNALDLPSSSKSDRGKVDTKSVATQPPSEEFLISHTLWPEIDKLYGHVFEVIALACNHRGTLLASASVGKKQSHATIRLWDTHEWKEVAQLSSHQLSVVQMAFSHDDTFLLTVSRDRHFSLFMINERYDDSMRRKRSITTQLLAKVKAHARIIWSCSWSYDDEYFVTAARDKLVKVWRINQKLVEQLKSAASASDQTPDSDTDQALISEDMSLPTFHTSVTAVALAPTRITITGTSSTSSSYDNKNQSDYLLAVGMEDGMIELWQGRRISISGSGSDNDTHSVSSGKKRGVNVATLQWQRYIQLDYHICHADVVRRLIWRKTNDNRLQLASCSDDHSIRIFTLQ